MEREPVPVHLGFPDHRTEGLGPPQMEGWSLGVPIFVVRMVSGLSGGYCEEGVRLMNIGMKRRVKLGTWFREQECLGTRARVQILNTCIKNNLGVRVHTPVTPALWRAEAGVSGAYWPLA